jgi:hypothetical protein
MNDKGALRVVGKLNLIPVNTWTPARGGCFSSNHGRSLVYYNQKWPQYASLIGGNKIEVCASKFLALVYRLSVSVSHTGVFKPQPAQSEKNGGVEKGRAKDGRV